MVDGNVSKPNARRLYIVNPRPCFWFLTSKERLYLWEGTQSIWVNKGQQSREVGGDVAVCSDKWSSYMLQWRGQHGRIRTPHKSLLNSHQSGELVCPEYRDSPPPSPILGKGKESTHSERWLIPRDVFILKRLFIPLQMIPNWTWNRLLQWGEHYLNQKRLEYCLFQVWIFLDILRGETYEELWAVLKKKKHTFFAHLSCD